MQSLIKHDSSLINIHHCDKKLSADVLCDGNLEISPQNVHDNEINLIRRSRVEWNVLREHVLMLKTVKLIIQYDSTW